MAYCWANVVHFQNDMYFKNNYFEHEPYLTLKIVILNINPILH